MQRARLLRWRAVKTLWDILLPFSDYAFNKAHSAAYGLVSYWTAYLKANYPAEYMAALLTSVKDDKDKIGDLPQRVPPDEDPGAAARRQRVARRTSPRSATTSASASPRSATSAPTSSTGSSRRARRRAATPTSTTSWSKVPALVCNKRVIESLIKAGAFDDMKHQRRALVAIHETAVDQYVDIKRNEAIGQDSLFGGLDDDAGGGVRHLGGDPRHRRVGQDDAARPRARDARPLRLRPPAARPRARARQRHRLHHRPADARRGARRRLADHDHRAGHLGAAQDHQARRRLGDGHRSRTSTARSTCCSSRAPTSWPARCLTEDAIITVKGRLSRSKDQPELHGQEVTRPRPLRRARPGRS